MIRYREAVARGQFFLICLRPSIRSNTKFLVDKKDVLVLSGLRFVFFYGREIQTGSWDVE